jgi:ATP-dependent RNA helicase SUPV3L1/SUV3
MDEAGQAPGISWKGDPVAALLAGPSLLTPEIRLDRGLLALGQDVQKQVVARLATWIDAQKEKHLLPLTKMVASSADPEVPAVVRAVFAQLADAGGVIARTELDSALGHLDKDQRHLLRRAGIDIGVLDIYHPGLLKPGAARWRAALLAARIAKPCLPLPQPGLTLIPAGEKSEQMGARIAGFRGFGDQMLRIDMAERMARAAHEAIAKGEAFTPQSPQIVSLGLSEPAFLQLMRLAGFRPVEATVEGGPNWAFRGRQKSRQDQQQSRGQARRGAPPRSAPARSGSTAPAAAPVSNHAFAGLAELLGRNG